MFPVLMFGGVSGAHINPAMTLAQAVNGMFPWSEVLPYICAQILGAAVGQLIVYICYYPHYKETESAEAILGTFCTTDAYAWSRRGIRSRAGLRPGPVGPPSEQTRPQTMKPTTIDAAA